MSASTTEQRICGIIRPIAGMDEYSEAHWSDVHEIVCAALEGVGFSGRLVSSSEYTNVIQGSIVKNLYEDPLVICDVSGRNANVMFELGMRLAFDKPTIIIKDDATPFSFDTSPIAHLPYPRDLRYQQMVEFKDELGKRAVATADAPNREGFTSFLSHFGPIVSAKMERKEVSGQEFILGEIGSLKEMLKSLTSTITRLDQQSVYWRSPEATAALKLAAAGVTTGVMDQVKRDRFLGKAEEAGIVTRRTVIRPKPTPKS